MRPKISNKNLNFYLAQTYGYANLNQFFKISGPHPKHKEQVITKMVTDFTGYKFENGKLQCYNPYTGKHETLKIKNFYHVQTKEELMKELMMLHKTRMQMLVQSRKRILQLSKQKTNKRDHDLEHKASGIKNQRMRQLDQKSKAEKVLIKSQDHEPEQDR